MTNEATITATDKWTAAADTGFAARYSGDESAAITDRIFRAYEDGTGIGTIARDLGLSPMSVKSRMLTVLLREAYDDKPMLQHPTTEEWYDEADYPQDEDEDEADEAEADAADDADDDQQDG